LDVWAEHLEYPELRRKVVADWSAKYGGNPKEPGRLPSRVDSLLVEDKGSGIALIKDLRQAHIPAIPYNPGRADKISRAHIIAPLLDLELFYVLESKKEPGKPVSWARDFIAQCNSFPNDEHDDMVDAFTQGLRYLRDAKFLDLPVAAPDEVQDYDYHRDTQRRVNPYGA
jgi:predicted phage terminase large subunit-like protein